MRIVKASETKAKLLSLLDEVEKGQTFVITRHGKVIARIVPDEAVLRGQHREAFQNLAEIGRSMKERGATLDEILSA